MKLSEKSNSGPDVDEKCGEFDSPYLLSKIDTFLQGAIPENRTKYVSCGRLSITLSIIYSLLVGMCQFYNDMFMKNNGIEIVDPRSRSLKE